MNELGKKNKKPVLKLPLTNYEKVLEIISAVGIIVIVLLTITSWDSIPDRIPMHFDILGVPDAWQGKGWLLFCPIVALGLYLSLSIVNKYPHAFNYLWKITEENAKAQYQNARFLCGLLKSEIIWAFSYSQWKVIQISFGNAEGLGKAFIPIFLISIIGTMGFFIYKARQIR